MKKSAIPEPGESRRSTLPDSFDGIRYEIGRLVKDVQEGRKEPLVLGTAQRLAVLSLDTARQLKQKVTSETKNLVILEGLWAWGRAHFEHVSDPANMEVIKTPCRMLRELEIPEALATALWGPIRDAMAKAAGKDPAKLKLPTPKVTGNSGVATCLVLTLAAAVGMDVRMRLGGHDGAFYYLWGQAGADGRWVDVDILHHKFGKHLDFEQYEQIDIPI